MTKPTTIHQAFADPKLEGKIVIESPEGLFATSSDQQALKKLRILRQKYSSRQIISTIIPKSLSRKEQRS